MLKLLETCFAPLHVPNASCSNDAIASLYQTNRNATPPARYRRHATLIRCHPSSLCRAISYCAHKSAPGCHVLFRALLCCCAHGVSSLYTRRNQPVTQLTNPKHNVQADSTTPLIIETQCTRPSFFFFRPPRHEAKCHKPQDHPIQEYRHVDSSSTHERGVVVKAL